MRSSGLQGLPRRLKACRRSLLWLGCLLVPLVAQALPSPQEVRRGFQPSETYILSREGELLQRLRTDMQVRRGQWVALSDTSPALRLALLVSEDKRFYAHSGVDWKAVSAAAWGQLWHRRTRGASTITMQLAGLLDEDWRASNQGRSVGQKLGQAVAATQLERQWRKDQILEAYLNLLPFRGELVGIDALSRSLFGKAAHGLDAVEAAIAAALVRGPNASPEVVAQRACGVWQDMQAWESRAAPPAADCGAIQWRTQQSLRARLWPASEGLAPHWAQRVWQSQREVAQAPSARVTTTVSASVQRLAVESLQRHLRELQGRNVEDGAVLVLDNASGQVLAWVGSSGGLSQAAEVDGVLAWRQPGSTLKPFLYAQALQEGRVTAASLLEDSPAHIATPSGLYIPQNYDRKFKGWVSVRSALAGSLNVPAVRALVMVTPDAFFNQLRQLGLPLRENAGYYGYSLALGSAEVPLLHLTNAYRALANGGQFAPVAPAVLGAAPRAKPVQVLSPQAAFVVGDILSDAQARASTFGLDSVLATRFWTAVKTGTSKDMRDNWAVGWSQRYTVGVWVGNASGEAMHSVSGSSGAAPIWADIMAALHARLPSRAPSAPPGLRPQAVQFVAAAGAAALEPGRKEWFLEGTQQPVFAIEGVAAIARDSSTPGMKVSEKTKNQAQAAIKSTLPTVHAQIAQPVSGTILALDPDIPPQHQRLQLQARPMGAGSAGWQPQGLRWQLVTRQPHGETVRQELGRGSPVAWLPWPGRHRLELRDAAGQLQDSVELEVRGAGARQPQAAPSSVPSARSR
ncbi:penicillin-binding protein 1C [Comamonas aquatica]|uniref:peptidoglycan glycosyltransferase n=1 Tax=Comamonas aquatica TaxID=225991 RepID=A0AA35GI90_9BURK|nr:Penicillin-binding protein 4 precursor [Comamonas aquatica]CAB5691296.1 Penicillin-binding protein 4 precursor [Comamonas aquatica]CAC9198158.1 Penicillin-binding protein 4 precursor [Comamonas aquatica]CAC9689436.1 Penicillin-binding protein 4 precursor [Comamonas aquatica]